MKVSNSFFFNSFAIVALVLLLPFWAAGQQYVKVINEKGEAIEDAIITYAPLNLKSFQKIAITNTHGRAEVSSETVFSLVISKMGYVTIADTLQPKENKTFTLTTNNIKLENVVITGQFEPVSMDKSVQRIKVIDRKRIDQQAAINLKDLLSNELNIRINQDGVLGSQITMMGLSGQNVKILLDGVPLIGRNDGNIDISQLNLNNIDRVEIVEGPMSVIYGTDALGGVINLISKKPSSKQITAGVNTYYETVGTYNVDGNFGISAKNTQFSGSLGRNFFDGYSENEDPELRVMQWKPKEQYFADGQLRMKFNKQTHRLFSQYFHEKITARYAPDVTPYSVTGMDDYFVTIRNTTSLYSDFYFNNKAVLNLINSYSYYERRKIAYIKDLVSGDETLVPSAAAQDTSKFMLAMSRGTYTTSHPGVVNHQMGYDFNLETGTGEKLDNGRQQIGDYAFFYISDIKATKRLTMRQGIRFIYNTRYGAPVIPSLNLKYDLTSAWALRLSYAQGFRAPSLKELSLFFVDVNHNIKGNNDLKAERSNNYLASLTYSKGYKNFSYKVDGLLFYNSITDMISLAVSDPVTQLYTYVNIDRYKTQGFNLNTDFKYKNIGFNAGYGLTGRYNQLSQTTSTEEFLYSHELRGNVSYSLVKAKLDLALFYKYTGKLPNYIEENGVVTLGNTEAYHTMDASITKRLFKNKLAISAGAKNLFDIKNINFASTASAHSQGGGSTPIAMGRYYFIGVRFNVASNQ